MNFSFYKKYGCFSILLISISLHAMEQQGNHEYELFKSKESELTKDFIEKSANEDIIKVFKEFINTNINAAKLEQPNNLLDGIVQLNKLFRNLEMNLKGNDFSFRINGLLVDGAEIPSHPLFTFWMQEALQSVLEKNEKVKNLKEFVVGTLAKAVTEDNKIRCIKLVEQYLPTIVAKNIKTQFAHTYGWYDKAGTAKREVILENEKILDLLAIDVYRVASVLSNNTVKIWNTKTGKCEKTFDGFMYDPIIAAQGKKLLIGDDQLSYPGPSASNFKVFDVITGKCLQSFVGSNEDFLEFMLFDDSKCISYGLKGIKIWDISCTDGIPKIIYQTQGYNPIKISKDLIVFVNLGNFLEIMNINSNLNSNVSINTGYRNPEYSVNAYHNSEQFLVASANGIIQLLNIKGECLQTFKGHSNKILQMMRIDNSTFASCSTDRTVKIWDIKSGICKKTIKGFNTLFEFHSHTIKMQLLGSHFLVVASSGSPSSSLQKEDGKIKVFDIQNGKCLRSFARLEDFSGGLATVGNKLLYYNRNKLKVIKPTFDRTINFLAKTSDKEICKQNKTKKTENGSCIIS